jgi:hypothetical protein
VGKFKLAAVEAGGVLAEVAAVEEEGAARVFFGSWVSEV